MCKTFFLLLSLSLICSFGYSQNRSFSIYKKYADTTKLVGHSDFYLVSLNKNIPEQARKEWIAKSLRTFNDSTFIVSKNFFDLKFDFIKSRFPANNSWKLSDNVEKLKDEKSENDRNYQFTIQLSDSSFLRKLYSETPGSENLISILPGQNILSLTTTLKQIEKYFLKDNRVLFIDVNLQKPKEELGVPGFDLSVNKIDKVHALFPGINGAGLHVSIKEEKYDTTDIDLKGRMDFSPYASTNVTNHANFMATIIAGAGNSDWNAKGAAWGANISSSSFETILPDPDEYYQTNKISVQNHSYGTLIDNNYGLNAVAFDKSAYENPNLLHIFSSGNSGGTASTSGTYSGITEYANLTGNFKMAKNVLVVGATDSMSNIVPQSSCGPAFDGRIKPDIVAFQINGSSESAALVSGTALLMQQYYKTLNANNLLPAALLKAILINTADDIEAPGPDFTSGFGNMNAPKAMKLLKKKNYFSQTIKQNETQIIPIQIPANIKLLKITLVWNDTTATPMSPRALVNDLDLSLKKTAENKEWLPWILNTFPNVDSLKKPAARGHDHLNNVEQITVENPGEGSYQLLIEGHNLFTSSQKYYMAYDLDSINTFEWIKPSMEDLMTAGQQNTVSWETNMVGNAFIEYSLPPFTNWIPIATEAVLADEQYKWQTPDTLSKSLLRIKANNQYYYSDTFLITQFIKPHTGLICGDSLLIHWNKLEGVNQYEIYTLGEKYLQASFTTKDTSILLNKKNFKENFIAVAPVLPSGETGFKSYAFDFTLQGAGCYINSFLVYGDGAKATLSISPGTTYQVDSIIFEKQTSAGFIPLLSVIANNKQEYNFDFQPLPEGISTFRAVIKLKTGEFIYSTPQSVFYVAPGKYLQLPNPVKRGENISIYTPLPDGEIFSLFEVTGKRVYVKEIQSAREDINTSKLSTGFYFYRITKGGKNLASGKIVIVN